jgi:hypothetical protein
LSLRRSIPNPARRRCRPERGAALVEFALVIPVFLMLVMGTIDFGATFNDYNSVRQGVREGARQVVVADWDLEGCTTGTSSQRAACLTSKRIGLDPARTRVRIELGGDYAPGQQLTVCAMYRAGSLTGFFGGILDRKALTSRITMRVEQIDDAAPLSDFEQTPFPGQDWSWC